MNKLTAVLDGRDDVLPTIVVSTPCLCMLQHMSTSGRLAQWLMSAGLPSDEVSTPMAR